MHTGKRTLNTFDAASEASEEKVFSVACDSYLNPATTPVKLKLSTSISISMPLDKNLPMVNYSAKFAGGSSGKCVVNRKDLP